MTQNTKIEWADHTFNPWWGCTKVSPACDHCYAAALDKRTGGDHWGTNQPRKRTSAKNWLQPVKRNKQADVFFAEHGRRQRVFCASMADVFDNSVDPQWRSDLFALIAVTPNLDWLILTKRIGNAARMMAEATASAEMVVAEVAEFTSDNPWPNFWLGATICSQEEADRDIPKLLATPAAKRFLSIEPMLGAIDLEKIHHTNGYGCSPCSACDEPVYINSLYGNSYCKNCCDGAEHPSIDWVICGGESGPGARPMHPDWARSLRDQCDRACVPFLFKQWGEWAQAPFDHGRGWSPSDPKQMMLQDSQEDGHTLMIKVGKKAAGRLLDGIEHNSVPIQPVVCVFIA